MFLFSIYLCVSFLSQRLQLGHSSTCRNALQRRRKLASANIAMCNWLLIDLYNLHCWVGRTWACYKGERDWCQNNFGLRSGSAFLCFCFSREFFFKNVLIRVYWHFLGQRGVSLDPGVPLSQSLCDTLNITQKAVPLARTDCRDSYHGCDLVVWISFCFESHPKRGEIFSFSCKLWINLFIYVSCF